MSTSTLRVENRAPVPAGTQGGDAPASALRAARTHTAPRRHISILGSLGFLAAAALIVFGVMFPLRRYIVPNRGLGYALGIAGASMMLLLFLYSARKRLKRLAFLGPVSRWFRMHMVFGVLGPLCILYHCDFTPGAPNSNVALLSMLTVAGSGLVGRYLYAHIHRGLYGQRLSVAELRERAESLRSQSADLEFLPELLVRLQAIEQRLLAVGPNLPILAALKPPVLAAVAAHARWSIHRYIRRELRRTARTSPETAAQRTRLTHGAYVYADQRIDATRRLAAFQAFERLFSLWHVLHLPLVFVLVGAAIVHVIAVSIY